jgi:hypothetical protein
MPLAAVRRACPRLSYLWIWIEGAPEPAVEARFGAITATIEFADTVATAGVYRITMTSTAARTSQGLGPGSSVRDLVRRLGPLELLRGEGELSLFAISSRKPGLSFELSVPGDDGRLVARVLDTQAPSLLPSKTVVASVLIVGH